jgi:hypothetical protein
MDIDWISVPIEEFLEATFETLKILFGIYFGYPCISGDYVTDNIRIFSVIYSTISTRHQLGE